VRLPALCECSYIQFFLLIHQHALYFFFFLSSLGEVQDTDGNIVYDKDDKPHIHTDGTGFISEDLGLLCPHNFTKESKSEMKILRFVILDLFPYKIRFDCLYVAI